MYTASMSPIVQFPTITQTSRYLPTSPSLSYNINDYLPSRVQRSNKRQCLPPFQLNFSNNKSEIKIKECNEKIKVLESRIVEMNEQREKERENQKQKEEQREVQREKQKQKEIIEQKQFKIQRSNQNTQTDICSFYQNKRLGWGERMQITIVPIKKITYQSTIQTDTPVQQQPPILKTVQIQQQQPEPLIPNLFIPKLQIPLPAPQQLSSMPPISKSTTRRDYSINDRYQKISITQRNKENTSTNTNRYHNNIKQLKDDSVDLHPVRVHEVMDIVRMMLSKPSKPN